jgi:hypothetical protein
MPSPPALPPVVCSAPHSDLASALAARVRVRSSCPAGTAVPWPAMPVLTPAATRHFAWLPTAHLGDAGAAHDDPPRPLILRQLEIEPMRTAALVRLLAGTAPLPPPLRLPGRLARRPVHAAAIRRAVRTPRRCVQPERPGCRGGCYLRSSDRRGNVSSAAASPRSPKGGGVRLSVTHAENYTVRPVLVTCSSGGQTCAQRGELDAGQAVLKEEARHRQ